VRIVFCADHAHRGRECFDVSALFLEAESCGALWLGRRGRVGSGGFMCLFLLYCLAPPLRYA
jgi:hypothetical protein